MRYLFVLALFLSALQAGEPTCYTVQLLSRSYSESNHQQLQDTQYDASCRVMHIGKKSTVRCGCFEKMKEAKSHRKTLLSGYPKAFIVTTYKSRFATQKPKEVLKEVVKEEDNKSSVVIVPPVVAVAEPVERVKPDAIKKIDKPEKVLKKKAKRSKQEQVKVIKKRESVWFYDRYLDKLKGKKSRFYDYKYSFGAQLSYDLAYFDEADKDYFEDGWRRVRINHAGSFLDEKLFYELEYSFTGNNNFKDIYLGYKDKWHYIESDYRVKAGNIKIPFSLDSYSSSKNITFMERALTDAFSDNRQLGVELLLSKKVDKSHLNLFGALYTNSIDENIDDETLKSGYAVRGTYAYKFNKYHLLSLGAAYQSRSMEGDSIKFNQGAESKYVNKKYVSVTIKGVDSVSKANIEALYINNEYSLQAEYTHSFVDALNERTSMQNYNFYAYYLQASYFLVGVGKRYKFKTATLGKIKPKREGAVELAMRYSYINLNDTTQDKKEEGGTQNDYTFALNWYVNREMKVMLNYIIAEPDVYKTDPEDSYQGLYQVLQARVLFSF